MTMNLESENTVILDVLKEIGNIGAGNAATALAKMINTKVDMKVPKVRLLDFNEVPDLIGGAETIVSGVLFKLEGEVEGSFMFVLDQESAINLVNLLMPRENPDFDDFTISALKEIGNILSGSYISSLSTLTNLKIMISVPSISVDMAGAILSVPAIEFGQLSDKVMIIENEFFDELGMKSVNGFFFLIPELESYTTILKSLGIPL